MRLSALLAALVVGTTGAAAQSTSPTAPTSPPANAAAGPPPPTLPETISRDDAGRATVRAVCLTTPLRPRHRAGLGLPDEADQQVEERDRLPDEGAAGARAGASRLLGVALCEPGRPRGAAASANARMRWQYHPAVLAARFGLVRSAVAAVLPSPEAR